MASRLVFYFNFNATHAIAALGTCYYHTEQETCAHFDKKRVMSLKEIARMTPKLGTNQKTDSLSLIFPLTLLLSVKAPSGTNTEKVFIKKKSLYGS